MAIESNRLKGSVRLTLSATTSKPIPDLTQLDISGFHEILLSNTAVNNTIRAKCLCVKLVRNKSVTGNKVVVCIDVVIPYNQFGNNTLDNLALISYESLLIRGENCANSLKLISVENL